MASSTSSDGQPLADSFGRRVTYLRVSVTDRCNFRCQYCMPEHGIEHLPRPELLTFAELRDLVTLFARHGVTRVRITGGEPLVRSGITELVATLAAVPGLEEVVMTTNGFLLAQHAVSLRQAGLGGLNVSLDSLDPDVFRRLTRVGDLTRVVAGIDAAIDAGFEPLKLNAVIVRGENDHELPDLVRFAAQRGAIMRFIEYMPIGDETGWGGAACFSAREMRERLAEIWTITPQPGSYGRGPARYWRAHGPDLPEEGAAFGIIGAVTECFCASCNRVRISPQGGLRACLADDRELSLRDALRLAPTPAQGLLEAERLIRAALGGKKEAHAFDLRGSGVTRTAMTSIGG